MRDNMNATKTGKEKDHQVNCLPAMLNQSTHIQAQFILTNILITEYTFQTMERLQLTYNGDKM